VAGITYEYKALPEGSIQNGQGREVGFKVAPVFAPLAEDAGTHEEHAARRRRAFPVEEHEAADQGRVPRLAVAAQVEIESKIEAKLKSRFHIF